MMEGRCAAEPWAELGLSVKPGAPLVRRGAGTDVFICTGSEEVYVFSAQEKRVRAVLQLPAPVRDLDVSHDKQLLFVACRSGIYRVNFQLLSHSGSSDAGSGPAELKISSDFLAVAADGVSSLLLVDSVLLTLCQTDRSWLLTLYKTPQQSQANRCDVIGSFSLPVVSPSVQGHTESKCVLLCVCLGEVTQPSSPAAASDAGLSRCHLPLRPALFKLLFGVEAALAKSPVILCGLPDGRLCYLPLRLPGSRLRVLQSLEQPVVFIGASAAMETDAGCAGCLVALGKQGRVMLIKAGRAGSERQRGIADFTEGCVPGPVECACVDKSRLYYSTGSDLLTLGLSVGSTGREGQEWAEEASGSTAASLNRPTSLNVSGVVALDQPTCNDAGEVQLLSLSARGRLQRISLPVRGPEEGSNKLPSSAVGRSVGDLLSAIGDVCERASVLEKVIRWKNQTLKQLNQVLNVSFLLTDGAKTEEKPIRCCASVGWSRLLQKDSLNLACVLQNFSPYILERGWTLSLTVLPLSCSPQAAEEARSVNYSFPFCSLCPGESLEVSLPVAAAGDASFPVTVACSLVFSLCSFLGGEEAATPPDLPGGCFSLPLNTLTVDWLHALRLISPTSTQKTLPPQSSSNPAGDLRAFLSSRRAGCRAGDGAPRPEGYSARVRVSSELLGHTLRGQRADPDPKVSESAPRSFCVSLLEWLLSEECGGVRMGHKGDKTDISSSVICGRAPNDATVKLTAKEVHLEEKSDVKEESLVSVEVQVESSSAAAVCGLHHAVLRRIQTLLLKAPVKAWSSNKVQISGLRQTLQRAEIQQGQISEALSVGMSSGQMQRILLRVYQQLRDGPLLMV
ncbi:Fanconi anemia core complex-associated protein 100 [Fundulus heteroclitus]|uniref:Fanconi anemia core complex-associated protein 100 n=1 Tax=Fundulus heteroclitus TaxID=8078 RepID=UPI00165C30BC|nr:Fanconi anemia core complex-associated protein 100 [Fundulus heteroclitus]